MFIFYVLKITTLPSIHRLNIFKISMLIIYNNILNNGKMLQVSTNNIFRIRYLQHNNQTRYFSFKHPI